MFKGKKGEKIKVRIIKSESPYKGLDQPPTKQFVKQPLIDEFTNETEPAVEEKNFSQEKPKKFKKILIFIIVFLILITGATLAGFYIFSGVKKTSFSVDLKIQAPIEVASGEEVEYLIEIRNRENVALTKVDLLLQYPFGFEFSQSDILPVNEIKNSFSLTDINAGEKFRLKISGRLVGEINETKNIEAILNYQPVNFSSNFQIKKTAISIIKSSIVELTIDYPATIIGTQSFELKIKYKNNQANNLNNIRIIVEPPTGLIIEENGTTPWQGEYYWDKETLTVNQQEEIVVKNHFEQDQTVSEKLEVKVGLLENEQFKIITYKRINLSIINPAVEIKLTLNNQEEVKNINWQEELNYQIKINNNSENFNIPNAILKLKLNPNLLDKDSLVEDNGANWVDDGLSWGEESKLYLDFLQEIKPGQEKVIAVKVKTIAQPANLEDYSAAQLAIEAIAEISSLAIGENFQIQSNKIITTVGELVQFSAKAFYYLNENIQVGSGSIPPQVGEKTSYKIYWFIDPGNNNLKNLEIKAILPPGINWEENFQATIGELTFDETSRQITWQFDELLIGDNAQAYFYVSLTPVQSQVGQVVTILNPSTATYDIDDKTSSQTADLLDTNLEDDPVKQGQGAVAGRDGF